jgi:hypothetical protein
MPPRPQRLPVSAPCRTSRNAARAYAPMPHCVPRAMPSPDAMPGNVASRSMVRCRTTWQCDRRCNAVTSTIRCRTTWQCDRRCDAVTSTIRCGAAWQCDRWCNAVTSTMGCGAAWQCDRWCDAVTSTMGCRAAWQCDRWCDAVTSTMGCGAAWQCDRWCDAVGAKHSRKRHVLLPGLWRANASPAHHIATPRRFVARAPHCHTTAFRRPRTTLPHHGVSSPAHHIATPRRFVARPSRCHTTTAAPCPTIRCDPTRDTRRKRRTGVAGFREGIPAAASVHFAQR